MPRRSKNTNIDDKQEKKNKKNLMNTIVKDVTIVDNEDIILQLPITDSQIDKINNTGEIDMVIPAPYEPDCFYLNDSNTFNNIQDNIVENDIFPSNNCFHQTFEDNTPSFTHDIINSTNNCYWDCHPIDNREYGMPYKYNVVTNTYSLFGSFCSLQCANAYNFSVHCGSDKVWEINSFIQMLGKHYGIVNPIRPAPSRFLLKMFNGPLTITEFRNAHLNNDKTCIINLPPMISTNYNYEIINTSYLKNVTDSMNVKSIQNNGVKKTKT
jgi:hypothetical protein